ncbi:squamosa promoter-binding-like protein 1 [Arachis stenosperma]|uniref:squamosa promoter-binding-like protein 1 n=1 Tax=Arachis stenosperma TaxID=217475 RepID=UPI0025AC8928|nr:squamosa promoter-binding-like protein 1 [Arachis stenosperma]
MEARFGGKNQFLYGAVVPEMKGVGKRSLEWDLNDWRWDGDLFGEGEEREELNDGGGGGGGGGSSLNLNLGAQVYPIMVEGDEKSGKKTKVVETAATTSNRAVCQVQDCRVDLSGAKDYHRRHKVCDVHSKATKALVGNVMQRFCQQCSRFHALEEFDEGKRSCRRRLAGHNRRRRKTHPDAAGVNGGSLNGERGSSYLLMSLLRILSNMHSNGSDNTRNQDILSHLLGNLANLAGTLNERSIASLLEGSQGLVNSRTPEAAHNVPNLNSNGPEASRPSGSPIKTGNGAIQQDPPRSMVQCEAAPLNAVTEKCVPLSHGAAANLKPSGIQPSSNVLLSRDSQPSQLIAADTSVGRDHLNNIDLNNVYDDTQDCAENPKKSSAPVGEVRSLDHPLWLQCNSLKSSPPQTSINSDSTSTQSPSSSSGEAQSRTDRIVFKLFGKDPSDFPHVLRSQILNWLSHSPTEIESYIRPGCIVLTIYLRLEKSAWEELSCNLGSSLSKLASNDSFWTTGWVYTRVQQSVAFLYNGQVVLDAPLHLRSPQNCRISCIKPLAVPKNANAKFTVKGFNLFRSSTRMLCAFEGKYLVHDSSHDLIDVADVSDAAIQHLSFSCQIPNVTGRGFVEVEDHGLSSCSFPFIVAEQEICTEICKLENVIEAADATDDVLLKSKQIEEKTRALEFLQEMGWLLHRSRLNVRLGTLAPTQDPFHFNRFVWLVDFSMDHDWCAVVKKLLDIIFEDGVDVGDHASIELALLDMGLLHKAVKRNSRPMVELLLKFVPTKSSAGAAKFLFRPDNVGPAGLTPLHVAASMKGSENVLDALTDDPGMVGIEAWKSARDNTGLTPNDYASLRGYFSYIQLVQKNTNKRREGQHVLDIPGAIVDSNTKQKQLDVNRTSKLASLHTEKLETTVMASQCGICQHRLAYGGTRAALVYRPAMLSLVAIAAVCVCVALLFKSSPKVYYVFQPFNWESLGYGYI